MAKTKDLVDEFLQAGVDAERARRLAQDRRRQRTIAGLTIGLALISVLAIVASWLAYQTTQQASGLATAAAIDAQRLEALSTSQAETARERDVALSRQLASDAQARLDDQLDLALLLAVEAGHASDTALARQALLDALRRGHGLISMLQGHQGDVIASTFSPNGKWLAAASCDIGTGYEGAICYEPGEIRLWDVSDRSAPVLWGAPLTVTQEALEDGTLALSQDGKRLALCSPLRGTITLWDLADPEAPVRSSIEPAGPFSCTPGLTVSANGQVSEVGDDFRDHLAAIEDTDWGREVARFGCSQDWESCAVSACTAWEGEICKQSDIGHWDVSKPTKQLWEDYPIAQSLPGEVYGLALSPDEQVLAVGGCGLRAASGSCSQGRLWLMATPDHPSPMADIAGLRFTGPPGFVTQVAFHPDGKLLASAGCAAEQEYDEYCDAGGEIQLWAVPAPGQALPLGAPLDGPDTPLTGLTFSLDGTTLAVCGGQATTMLWDLTDAAQPVPLGAPAAGQIDCRSPCTLEADGTVSGVEPGTGPLAEMLAGDLDRAVFSPDGAIAATYFRDITLWDLAEPSAPVEINQSLLGYASFRYVTAVAFSPDGLLLAATSCESVDGGPCQDSELRLWDVSEPRSPVALGEPLSGPAGEPVDLVFGPDGSTLAASSYKAIMLWEIGVDNWQERACQIAGRNLTGEEWQRHLGDRDYRETCP